jgi:hypothetical protein
MWGTDWTRAIKVLTYKPIKVLTYKQGVEAFRVTDRLSDSERSALIGGTLQQIYNWRATQAELFAEVGDGMKG